MPFKIIVACEVEQMSRMAPGVAIADSEEKRAGKDERVLGLATETAPPTTRPLLQQGKR